MARLNLCNRYEQVEDVFNEAYNAVQVRQNNPLQFLKIIDNLKAVLKLVEQDEQYFYESYRLTSTPAQNLKILQQRIDKLNSITGLNNLTAGNTEELLSEIGVGENYSTEEIIKAINDRVLVDEEFKAAIGQTEILTSDGEEYLSNAAIAALNKYLNEVNSESGRFRLTKQGSDSIQGLQDKLMINWNNNDKNKLEFTITLRNPNRHLSSTMKARFVDLLKLDKKTKLKKFSEMNEIEKMLYREKVVQAVLKQLNGGNIKQLAEAIMWKYMDSFGIGTDKSNMHGFLGEVQLNIIMAALEGCDTSVIEPSGLVRQTAEGLRGRQIHIDAVIKGSGFQVKNYNLKSGNFDFSGENTGAGNFFKNRAEVPFADILIAFFAALHYNQPVTDNNLKHDDHGYTFADFDTLYKQMESFAASDSFNDLLKMYADKIIGLDKNIQIEGLEQPELYFNTFFFFQGKICPSSEILRSLINELQIATGNDLITSSFKGYKGDNTSIFQEDVLSGVTKSNKDVYSVSNMAKVNYRITLNVDKIIDRALSRI